MVLNQVTENSNDTKLDVTSEGSGTSTKAENSAASESSSEHSDIQGVNNDVEALDAQPLSDEGRGDEGVADPAQIGSEGKGDQVFAHVKSTKRYAQSSRLTSLVAAIGLPLAGCAAFFSTLFLLSPGAEAVDRRFLLALVGANVLIAAAFAALIGAYVWQVFAGRRARLAGSDTQLRLVSLFALVAAVPAFVSFLFSFTILRASLNDVFGDRIETSVLTSRNFANEYIQERAAIDIQNLRNIEVDIMRGRLTGVSPALTPITFRQRLIEQAFVRNLAAVFILDADKRIIARVELADADFALPRKDEFDEIDLEALQKGAQGQLIRYGANDPQRLQFLRGMLKSEALNGGYIIIYRAMPEGISDGLLAIRAMRDDWENAKGQRNRLERVFLAGFSVMALIVLFGAIWTALRASTGFVAPIRRLVRMAESVSGGDLAARVDVFRSDGELGVLARSMNRMTSQLQTQRDDLIETNRQFDRRRRFTEAVLSGVSAGVLGIDGEGHITIVNKFAEEFLHLDGGRCVGARLSTLVPEFQSLVDEAMATPYVEVARQLEIERGGMQRIINTRVMSDRGESGEGERSCVVTFDDVTELMDAHRSAAWGDVARRIAHEIKNPLTPIQLSAERLRRKYKNEVISSPEVFDKCTDTIVRHVSDIRRMVDEFSSFARMPEPVIANEDIVELIKSATFTQRVAFPEISFELDAAPDGPVFVACDGRLIIQAIGNLMKNACESIDARLISSTVPRGRVVVKISKDDSVARLDVYDNGLGLPKTLRHRLTEPYMTTREKGTGLGLAIVRKVIEDHGGSLSFSDSDELGPTGARISIVLPLAATAEEIEDISGTEHRPDKLSNTVSSESTGLERAAE
ncbi:MAG: PAS domain-containing sensor histidine kinase [Pseudomonadota bacterium]